VKTHVDAINSGIVPYLENAMMTLAQSENSVAVQKSAYHFSEHMAQQVSLPTDRGATGCAHSLQEGSHCCLHGALLQG
jgi:hypothetical protein